MRNISWAAGLFEGEGTFARRKNIKPAWTAALSSTDQDVILEFARVTGMGKVYGPYGYVDDTNRRREHHKQYWRWSTSKRDEFLAFCAAIRPYLLSRRQAKLDEACADMVQLTSGRWPEKGN